MKSAPKVFNLIGKAKTICEPLSFPLSDQTLNQIDTLKYSFRNSFQDHQVYSLGLSAPQIGINKRFFIMPKHFGFGQVANFKMLKHIVRSFHIFINPSILSRSERWTTQAQYCLSVGFNQYKVKRPAIVEVQYYKEDGTVCRQKLDELRSRIFQHQYDHLEGILISEIGEKIPAVEEHRPKSR